MAVGAEHFAFRQLMLQPVDRYVSVNHVAHVSALSGGVAMIEFQHDWICLAALHARVVLEKLRDKRPATLSLDWMFRRLRSG
jgi:hypothetical protein